MSEPEKDKQQERIRTIYSNIVRIGHSQYEFMLDFGQFQPEGKKAFMDIRIITSPPHAKAILNALKDNISKYEEKFGVIGGTGNTSEEDDPGDGWQRRRR